MEARQEAVVKETMEKTDEEGKVFAYSKLLICKMLFYAHNSRHWLSRIMSDNLEMCSLRMSGKLPYVGCFFNCILYWSSEHCCLILVSRHLLCCCCYDDGVCNHSCRENSKICSQFVKKKKEEKKRMLWLLS